MSFSGSTSKRISEAKDIIGDREHNFCACKEGEAAGSSESAE